MAEIYTTAELKDPATDDPIGEFHAVVTNSGGEVRHVICDPQTCVHRSREEAEKCHLAKAARRQAFNPGNYGVGDATPSWEGVTRGLRACWRWISPACAVTHGSYEQALEVALEDVRAKFRDSLPHYEGKARFHVALTIEPFDEGA